MVFPFNPNVIKRNARAYGFNTQEAAIFTHLALDKLRELHGSASNSEPVSLEKIAEAIRQYAIDEVARETASSVEIPDNTTSTDMGIIAEENDGRRIKRFKFNDDGLEQYFGKRDPYELQRDTGSLKHHRQDIITAMCQHPELAVELGNHLQPKDLIALYSTSRTFHDIVNAYLLSSIRKWITYRAPEAGRVFQFKLYRRHLVPDPAGRTWQEQYHDTGVANNTQLMRQVRTVPGLRYFQLVLGRDRCCRQIITIMARNGMLMPKTMHHTLLRLWLLMDIPTTGQRQALMRNTDLWTDEHLYNAQLFFVKLSMLFNDPIYGPSTNELLHLTLGQKGLYPLWQLLLRKKYTALPELLEFRARYDFNPPEEYLDTGIIHGAPALEVGSGHLEGWGLGGNHLLRPDELVPLEAVARGLELDEHLMYMMVWGYIDFSTGENIVPSEEDLYFSDEEVAAHIDSSHHWNKKHVLKKNFTKLSAEQQQEIISQDEDDRLRALAWTGDTSDYPDSFDMSPYTLDDEIRRGYIVRPASTDKQGVPEPQDSQGWVDFVNNALATVGPQLNEDQTLRAEAWLNYHDEELNSEWNWDSWLSQESHTSAASSDGCNDDDDETIILDVEREFANDTDTDGATDNDDETDDGMYSDEENKAVTFLADYDMENSLAVPQMGYLASLDDLFNTEM